MYECKKVDISYFNTAKNRFKAVVEIDSTPEKIFACFEDADSWKKWAPPITDVKWTSPKPFGMGTTRTVSMIAGLVGDEVFIAWDYPKRMAFCFTHCSHKMVESFAEDYLVTPLDNGKTRLEWTMGITNKGIGNITIVLFSPFMRMANQWMLERFKKYVEKDAKQS
jgi:hypothetical protein